MAAITNIIKKEADRWIHNEYKPEEKVPCPPAMTDIIF